MTLKFLTVGLLMPLAVSAQKIEVVTIDVDVETGVIYYADSTQVNGTINADTMDCANSPIPQTPLEECDSLMVRDIAEQPVYWYLYAEEKR